MEEKRIGAAEKKPLDKKRVLLFAAIGAAALLVLALLIVMAVRGRSSAPTTPQANEAIAVADGDVQTRNAGGRSGFPLTFSGGSILDVKSVSGGMFTLTKDALFFVSTTGAYRTPLQHSYAKPVLKTGGKYALLFDRLTGDYTLCDARHSVLSGQSENGQQINTAAVNEKGEVLIASKGGNYASLLSFFNRRGELLFSWECAKEYIVSVAIAENRSDLLCAAVGAREDGEMYTKMYWLNIGKKDTVWETTLTGTAGTECAFAGGNDVLLVCADKRLLIDTKAKKEPVTEAEYPASAAFCHTAKGMTVVANQKVGTFDTYEISAYGKNNKVAASAQTEQHPLSVFCNGKQAFLLTDTGVYRVKRNGKLREVCTLSEMERGFVMVGGDAFHYNKNTLFKN